jgi:hypothetical protein
MTYRLEGWYEWNEHEEYYFTLKKEPTHWTPLPDTHMKLEVEVTQGE